MAPHEGIDAQAPSTTTRAAFWFAVSMFLFALMLALFKWVGQNLPVVQIIFLRQVALALLLLPGIAISRGATLKSQAPGLNLLRGGLSTGAMLAGFAAVVYLPLAEAATLGFTKVFFVVLLGAVVLREHVDLQRWGAVALGFLGTLIVLAPDTEALARPVAFLALLAALFAASIMIVVRRLAQVDAPATIMAWQSGVVLVAVAIPALIWWTTPTIEEWAMLGALGLLMWGVQRTTIHAHRLAEASALSPIEYTRLPYAAALGYVAFGDVPAWNTLLGAAVIVAAALWVQRRGNATPAADE